MKKARKTVRFYCYTCERPYRVAIAQLAVAYWPPCPQGHTTVGEDDMWFVVPEEKFSEESPESA